MILKRFLTLSIFISPVVNCFGQNNQVDSADFFVADNFFGDTLYIKAQFKECGEFGGHIELSKIYTKGDEFYVIYQKYEADCASIKENNGDPRQKLVRTFSKILLNDDKVLVRGYMYRLLEAKLREATPLHDGYTFQIKKSDNSLNIFVYPGDITIRSEYEQFIKQLIE